MKLNQRILSAGLLTAFVAVVSLSSLLEAGDSERRLPTITKPSLNADAEQVELFAAMKEGSLEAWLIPEDEAKGYVFIENKSDAPLTIQMPTAFVGVQNLKQFLGNGNGNGNGNIFGGPNNQNAQNQGGLGGNQSVGGGTSQNQNANIGNNGPFGNGNNGNGNVGNNFFRPGAPFFSIPPQRRVRLEFNSVCLNHGLKTPSRLNRYHLVSVDEYTNNEQLKELLSWVATGKVPQKTAQAATWHLTDDMSAQDLIAKKEHHLGGAVTNYFSRRDVLQAKEMLDFVDQQIAERKKADKNATKLAGRDAPYEK